MTSQRLINRPAWRDPLVWLWVIAIPASFQAAYVWEERVGDGPDSGAAWAIQIGAVWVLVSVVMIGLLVARRALRRTER